MSLRNDDARWQLTERVLTSTLFEKSPRLRGFLRFICEQELAGRREGINEHAIGVQVFGRQPSYNPGEDSIVRSQARFLRQRLEDYFKNEGGAEQLRIVIPKGSYVPLFEPNDSLSAPVGSPIAEPIAQPPDAAASRMAPTVPRLTGATPALLNPRPMRWIVGFCLLIAAAVTALLWQHHASSSQTLEEHFWASLFAPGRSSIIVPADSTLVLLEELTQQPVHLTDYLSRHYLSSMALRPQLASLASLGLGDSQYTSVADLNLASEIMRHVAPARDHAQIRYARDLSISDAKENNLILIGGARANPWVELFASRMNLYVDYDWATGRNVVINKKPSPGQPALYAESATDSNHRVYGLIAFLPSLDREGNTLLVAGTSSAGTEAAADFLLNGAGFQAFFQPMSLPRQQLPHFEMLVVAESLGGKAPQSSVLTYRALP